MAPEMQIGQRLVGDNHPAFIIAEASTNHNGDLGLAKELAVAAKESGADCVKFQTFTPAECLTPGKNFTYTSQGKQVTESEYDMFVRLAFNRDQWAELIDYCRSLDLLFLTTVQDSVDLKLMLELGGMAAIKKGSDDFDFLPSLIEAAETGLPLILSKGMATLGEVDQVVRAVSAVTKKLAVLHCVSLYPADPKLLNLKQIQTLKYLYPDIIWGFSDHSLGTVASTMAVGLGAKMIEKHFTLSHDMPGPDHWFSMDPSEMSQLVRDIRFVEQGLGNGEISPSAGEMESRAIMRRRVVARTDLLPGTRLTKDLVRFKRASTGAFLDQWPLLEGAILRQPRKQDEGILPSDTRDD